MKKKEFLKKINDGIERGSKRKLAKMLQIDPANVSEWFNGRSRPSEQNVQKMSGLFSIDEQELWDMFNEGNGNANFFQNSGTINSADNNSKINLNTDDKNRILLLEKDVELIKKTQENFDLRLRILELERKK